MVSFNSTAKEIREKKPTLAILAIGSTEQHGSHLPTACDTIIGFGIAEEVAKRMDAYLLPAMPYSTCHEHDGKMGSFTLRSETLYRVVEDITVALRNQGIFELAIVIGHGGIFISNPMVRELNAKYTDMKIVKVDLVQFFTSSKLHGVLECKNNLHVVGNLVQPGIGFLDGIRFGHKVHIVEAEIPDPKLGHKRKARVHLRPCMFHGAGHSAEGFIRRAGSEHVRARGAQIVPPRHGKGKVLAHLFAEDDAVGVKVLKRERIFRFGAFVLHNGEVLKVFCHDFIAPLFISMYVLGASRLCARAHFRQVIVSHFRATVNAAHRVRAHFRELRYLFERQANSLAATRGKK